MLHPKNWNVFCWGALSLWLAISVFHNYPLEPRPMKPAEMPQPGVSYGKITAIGCPFPYLRYVQTNTAPPVITYRPWVIVLNALLIAFNLFGIIYSIQTLLPRFSISTLFVVVTGMALFLPLSYFVFSTGNAYVQIGFIYGTYFAPIIATCPAFVYSRYRQTTANLEKTRPDSLQPA